MRPGPRRGTGRRYDPQRQRAPTQAPAVWAARRAESSAEPRCAGCARPCSQSRCYRPGGRTSPSGLGLVVLARRLPRVESPRTVRYRALDVAAGAEQACPQDPNPPPRPRAASPPPRRPARRARGGHRDAPPVRLRRLRLGHPGGRSPGERRPPPAGRPTAARDRRPPGRAPPPAPGQPVARDGDRVPGRQRRLARALAGRHAGERRAPEARPALGRRRLVRTRRAGTSCRAASAPARPRSTSGRPPAPTSMRRSTERSSRSTTSC